jgi:hypothetical protein
VEKPELDQAVGAALANECDCALSELPLREYVVGTGEKTKITVTEGSARVWEVEIEGGDRAGRIFVLPAKKSDVRFGRGELHGSDSHLRNDLVLCDGTEFVSRRAGRLIQHGASLEVEALDQGDTLFVRRASGEVVRPARTAKGRVALASGDALELTDGRDQLVRAIVRRTSIEESEKRGGTHA